MWRVIPFLNIYFHFKNIVVPACLCVCTPWAYLVPTEARRRSWMPRNWSYGQMWATWCECLTWTQVIKIISGEKTWDFLEITYMVMIELCVELRTVEAFLWVSGGVRNKDSEIGIEATYICFLSITVLTHHDQKQLKTERIYFSLRFQGDRVHPGWCHHDGVAGVGSRVITCHMSSGHGKQERL